MGVVVRGLAVARIPEHCNERLGLGASIAASQWFATRANRERPLSHSFAVIVSN
jgi:hypothetical protein